MINIKNYMVLFTIILSLSFLLGRDNIFLKSIKYDFLKFIKNNNFYWVAVILTAIISYGTPIVWAILELILLNESLFVLQIIQLIIF